MPEYYPLDRLSFLLQWVKGSPHQNRFDRLGPKLENRSPFHRISHCSQAILAGALPDAHTLEFVAMAFAKYVDAEGRLSLDEAFGLKAKPKAGNPARQYTRTNKILGLLYRMAMFRAHNPKITLESAAEAALAGDESIKVETLEREYRRRGCHKWVVGIKEHFEAIRGK